ncbi:uncharacterized protein LOC124436575 isoform X2 [Xenia sp. Carnegie-2017]|uniref:uncharacterized protein LOC124436575 isoform X2 n=1 Tax=Xenia sp. Carnegie-2017 TaxID=2897299 RepID=UPI001F0478C6|nr:uncharacterized protein LOC124436575 isoform X2 [Xenia sp. Carnegie-2017]
MYYSSYAKYPTTDGPKLNRGTVMLASAKEGLYHPRLPTFRRMDMDTVSQKLPFEHSRTTTNLTADDFQHAAVMLFDKTRKPLSEQTIAESIDNDPESSTGKNPQALTSLAETEQNSSTSKQSQRPYSNLAVGNDLRRMHPDKLGELFPAFRREPDETSFSKRYKFQYTPFCMSPGQKHFVDWTGRRPIPANTYSRYRDAHPVYSENISSKSWKP